MRLTDPYRLAALRQSALLDTTPEAVFDRSTRLASRLLNAPVALFSLVDEDRQFFKSQIGLSGEAADSRQTPLSHSFCQHVVKREAPLVVSDARLDPVLKGNGAISDLGVIAYLGVPIATDDGEVLGSFCVIGQEPRDWQKDEVALLEDIAAGVSSEVRLRLSLYRARTIEGKLADAVRALECSIAQRDALLGDVNHRLKNSLKLVVSMTRLERRASERGAPDRLTLKVEAIARAHELLYRSTNLSGIALADYLRNLCAAVRPIRTNGGRLVELRCEAADVDVHTDLAISIGMVVVELLCDAVEHIPPADHPVRLLIASERAQDIIRIRFTVGSATPDWAPMLADDRATTQLLRRIDGAVAVNGDGDVEVNVPLPTAARSSANAAAALE